MPNTASKPSGRVRSEGKAPYVTSAVGLGEPAGRVRARRSSLFTQTVVWVTALVSLAFLCGALVQAWSNNQLMQQLQHEQQITQQLQNAHDSLTKQVSYYQDPYVVEGEARQHLGYARPGEHVVVIVGGNTQNQAQVAPINQPAAPQNFWQAWWQIFFGNP
ncbi:MAG: FtsB family cell division protein [Ktedonobacteraceae bacterium]